jgi:uncharacterized flavoprotein (TIGR03862 family)
MIAGAMTSGREIIDVAVVGAGPAGLMAAEAAARAGARAVVFDAMPSPGRKFLMAGRSGLNITHAEDFEAFAGRYGAAAARLRPALERFSPDDMRAFCAGLGVETFVGTSGRVFPRAMKASPLLRAWLRRLDELGVVVRTRRRLVGIASHSRDAMAGLVPAIHAAPSEPELDAGTSSRPDVDGRHGAGHDGTAALTFAAPSGAETIRARAVVLALGGASWPRLGSTGAWAKMLSGLGVDVVPFRPSNCAVEIRWSEPFREKFEGQAIKTAAFSFGGQSVRGEAVVTRRGLEGGPVYALSGAIGERLKTGAKAVLSLDLKPDLTVDALADKLARRRSGDSFANALRKTIALTPVGVALLREFGDADAGPRALAGEIKALALPVRAVAGLDRAISTAGGIALDRIDANFMLIVRPGLFVTGEMLDWDAPTGGYLLQACFATGRAAGEAAARRAVRKAGRRVSG